MGNTESTEQNPQNPQNSQNPNGSEPSVLDSVSQWIDEKIEEIQKPSDPNKPEEPSAFSQWIDDLQKPSDPNKPEEPSAFTQWVSSFSQPADTEPSLEQQLPDFESVLQNSQQQPQQQPQNRGWGNSTTVQPTTKPIEQKGYLNIKIVKGFGFSKKDGSRAEIGFSNPQTNGWIDISKVKKSHVVKAADSPHYDFDFVGDYDKRQNLKLVFYGIEKSLVGKEKEYVIGFAKLDYQFFRGWYLQGRQATEKKIPLVAGSDKEAKAGTRYVSILIRYDGASLAPDKESVIGEIDTSAFNFSMPSVDLDVQDEFNQFVKDTSDMIDDQINEASEAFTPYGGASGRMKAAKMGSM